MNCSRCGQRFESDERQILDPCCSAPDCENLTAVSHYACLPYAFQKMEDEMVGDYDDYY